MTALARHFSAGHTLSYHPTLLHLSDDSKKASNEIDDNYQYVSQSIILPKQRITRTRRDAMLSLATTAMSSIYMSIDDAKAYTPDSDQLRESLYLISRVQEATVQQERLVKNSQMQEDLQRKMKLSLRLVDRSYRLLDQITYCSKFISDEDIVEATESGFAAADALQEAIDYVATGLGSGPMTEKQKKLLTEALTTTRQELFAFLKFMPFDKLQEARLRVEKENVDNREEFDGDANAGVYKPVALPWK